MMDIRSKIALAFLALVLAIASCSGELVSGDSTDGEGEGEPQPLCEVQATAHIGFAGTDLAADRKELAAGSDRARFKPISALRGEYQRVLGSDVQTALYRDTFGPPPRRWFEEPQASADILYAAFSLAYGGCLDFTAVDERFADEPAAATAEDVCGSMIERMTDRTASEAQRSACASYVVGETPASESPRKRWAYGCAAVLTSADFLLY